jgi:antitoxin PrlF
MKPTTAYQSTVSEKGQVVIPAALRKALGIKAGTPLSFELTDGALTVRLVHLVASSSIASGYGMLKAKPKAQATRRLSDFDVAAAMQLGKSA